MKFVGIIPARYASTRFPGKPLAILGGKTVIERVYTQASKSLTDLFVATDDIRIKETVESFGGKAIMTSPELPSGTDRCWQAYKGCGIDADVVINIQGDEPFIHPDQLDALKDCFTDPQTEIATLVKPFLPTASIETISTPNSPKVVIDKNMHALYFSRSVIPYIRKKDKTEWPHEHTYISI